MTTTVSVLLVIVVSVFLVNVAREIAVPQVDVTVIPMKRLDGFVGRNEWRAVPATQKNASQFSAGTASLRLLVAGLR
jgi:hypothetical protein